MLSEARTPAGASRASSRSNSSSSRNYGTGIPPAIARKPSLPPLNAGNSALLTAGIIIADVLGAGILSMGVAVAKFGWLLGTAVILLMLAMNVHISVLMWRVRMGCPPAFTYLDLSTAAFSRAPSWQRRLMEGLTIYSQQIFLFLCMSVYALSVGRSLGNLLYDEFHNCLRILVLTGLASFAPVCLSARSMGHYSTLIALNVLLIAGSAIIPVAHMASSGVRETRDAGSTMRPFEHLTFTGSLAALGTMNFAITSQNMIVEIMAEMKYPAEFPKAYYISAPFQAAMMILAGVGTYYYMGSGITGILGDNIPFGVTFRMAALCLLLHMLVTYLIKSVVVCRFFQSLWQPSSLNDTTLYGWMAWAWTVGLTMAATWLVSQLVPFFTDLVDLIGATLTPLNCCFIPIAMYARWLRDFGTETDTVGPFELTAIVLEVVLGLVLVIFGTYFSVSTILNKWSAYGLPFACHCENVWATCGCSAHHPGMEHCLSG
mmetsp:Transcript_74920/g.173705  ORF Transcript_74920/g.173705 Transcript_74920/m.173705 type:complete len:488 (-) Transcript_74920:8-1471(-)